MKISQQQAKQLKDYENAVIAKRLEELDDDEIQALVEEIERDEFWAGYWASYFFQLHLSRIAITPFSVITPDIGDHGNIFSCFDSTVSGLQ